MEEFGKTHKIKSYVLSEKNKSYIDNFDCGNTTINRYLKEKALDDVDSVTHLYVNIDNNEVIAFVTLTCSSIDICSSDGLYLGSRVSAVEIKYFATDIKYQHMKYSMENNQPTISDVLLDDAYENIRDWAYNKIGASKIILLSRPSAVNFYKRHSFKEFDENMFYESTIDKRNYKPMYADLYIAL